MAIQGVVVTRESASSPTVYIDDQGNYFTKQGNSYVNVGWDVVTPAQQAGTIQTLNGQDSIQARAATGLASGSTSVNGSAKAQLKMMLEQWGLGTLTDWAWGQLTAGASEDQVLLSIRDQDAYKQRFGNTNAARTKAGLQALSETEILAYEKAAAQYMRAAGMPKGLFDSPEDFKDLLVKDVSISELNQRVNYAKDLAVTDPSVLPDEVRALRDLYGVDPTMLGAYLLAPDRALPLIEKQIQAAEAAAAARRAGFGDLSVGEAERVGALTSSSEQAAQGFQQLARMRELYDPLPGEAGAAQISRGTAIEAQFAGNADAQAQLSRRQRARQAQFDRTAGDYSRGGLGRTTTDAL